MRTVDIRSVRTVFDDRFRIVAAELAYEKPDGAMSPVVRRLSFERGDSAAAVVVDRERGVTLLTRQFRYPTLAAGPGWPLELVAGVVDAGESPEESIRRELAEEIGYEPVALRFLRTFYPSPGGCSERVHLFAIEVTERSRIGRGGGVTDDTGDGEDIELVEVPLSGVAELLAGGELVDAKTLIGLAWLLPEQNADGKPR